MATFSISRARPASKMAVVALAALCAAAPAHAAVIYDFVTTSASGTAGGGQPFTDPRITLTVTDAVYAAGSYSYTATSCIPLFCQHTGDPNGISLRAGLDGWSPLWGSSQISLEFLPDAVLGSFFARGLSLDITMSGGSSGWSGSLNSDALSCRTVCAFAGFWQNADPPVDAPEPSGLAVLLGSAAFLRIWTWKKNRQMPKLK